MYWTIRLVKLYPKDTTMALYKFLSRKYFDKFFETGSLRLGTMYDFKRTEVHGLSRGDSSEGKHRIRRIVNEPMVLTGNEQEPLISDIISTNGGTVNLSNTTFVKVQQDGDGFIFCTSYFFSEQIFKNWHSENNVDACYEIVDPQGFIRAISNAISNSAYFFENHNITYTDEHIDYLSNQAPIHPAFTKVANNYSWQVENRSLWKARQPSGILQPWNISVPEAIQFCRPFATLEKNEIVYTN